MARKHKLASLAVAVLAVLFDKFFMFVKHNGALSHVIPFANDPYDAIGSMAVIMGTLLALLCLFRTYQPAQRPPSPLRLLFLGRAQIAVAMSVLIVLEADIVAMIRHLSDWRGASAPELLVLIGGLAAASFAVLALVRGTVRHLTHAGTLHEPIRAAAVLVVCIVALALYPERLIQSTPLHFLTILFGDVVFFASVSVLTSATLPIEMSEYRSQIRVSWFFSSPWTQWSAIVILGLAVGAFALLSEMFEGGGFKGLASFPPSRIVIVISMFLGSGASGLLMAFAFLKGPLGLFRKVSH